MMTETRSNFFHLLLDCLARHFLARSEHGLDDRDQGERGDHENQQHVQGAELGLRALFLPERLHNQ